MSNLSNQIQTALEQAAAPSVLTWKSKKIEGALITKIGEQRYLGVIHKDKKGQEYWRYHLLTKATESSANSTPNPAPISKPSSPAQPAPVDQSQELENSKAVEETEEVKKFRAKYGTPNQPQKPIGN